MTYAKELKATENKPHKVKIGVDRAAQCGIPNASKGTNPRPTRPTL